MIYALIFAFKLFINFSVLQSMIEALNIVYIHVMTWKLLCIMKF